MHERLPFFICEYLSFGRSFQNIAKVLSLKITIIYFLIQQWFIYFFRRLLGSNFFHRKMVSYHEGVSAVEETENKINEDFQGSQYTPSISDLRIVPITEDDTCNIY